MKFHGWDVLVTWTFSFFPFFFFVCLVVSIFPRIKYIYRKYFSSGEWWWLILHTFPLQMVCVHFHLDSFFVVAKSVYWMRFWKGFFFCNALTNKFLRWFSALSGLSFLFCELSGVSWFYLYLELHVEIPILYTVVLWSLCLCFQCFMSYPSSDSCSLPNSSLICVPLVHI